MARKAQARQRTTSRERAATLDEYRRKRDFRKTPEPRGEPKKPARGALPRFCVQKHDARRLHYDFRLEIGGVLKSWAVPKGPSLDPGTKRLAVPTEDHPLEYIDFEGIIPAGEYGGGTVLLWDQGTYRARGDAAEAYEDGRLVIELEGEKLRGGFTLVRTADDAWLLRKRDDDFARAGRGGTRAKRAIVESAPRSVKSGRDLDAVAAVGEPARMPREIAPALATLVDAPPPGDEHLHEIKLDGYRVLARVDHGGRGKVVTIRSRSGQDWTRKMPEVAEALEALPDGIYDGEAVVYDEDGKSRFAALVDAMNGRGEAPIELVLFDAPFLDGCDLRGAPLEQRKARLLSVLRATPRSLVRYCDHVVGDGPAFFEAACAHGLEGIVSKRVDSPYVSGRSRRWLKVRCERRQELVIVGYTPHTSARDAIGALVVAAHEPGKGLRVAGKVGTGFTERMRRELKRTLDARGLDERPSSIREAPPRTLGKIRWARPELVAEVRFTEWTRDGSLRHPTFLGLREDKPATAVVREAPRRAPRIAPSVPLTNPDKVLYDGPGLTKRDVAAYYARVAERMLPYAKGRPLMLRRCPDGVRGGCWYQKHPTGKVPPGFDRVSVRESSGMETYLVARTEEALVGLAQLGALEVHLWGSRADKIELPDRIVLDLDPAPDVAFDEVVSAAGVVRDLLASVDLVSFAMVTGGKGIHVVAPIERRHDFDTVKEFTHALARSLARERPDRFLAKMSKKARTGRIFVDYLRNGRGATAICPYSTRAHPDATISMPVAWEELSSLAGASAFTIADAEARMDAADPWRAYARTKQRLHVRATAAISKR